MKWSEQLSQYNLVCDLATSMYEISQKKVSLPQR